MSKSKKYINNKNNHNKGYNNHNRGYKMNFIRFLKINKNTRKVFGEREIKIIINADCKICNQRLTE